MGLDIEQFNACLDDNRPGPALDYARSEFDRRGLRGTPSFFLNGERVTNYSEIINLGDDS
jgi:2-hydroxychromene-2-carboxylate isomerase